MSSYGDKGSADATHMKETAHGYRKSCAKRYARNMTRKEFTGLFNRDEFQK